jgi:alpha-glucosidase
VPLPWVAEAPNYGFSLDHEGGRPAVPWLPQPDWFGRYAVDRQDGDPGSMLELYRAALATRRGLWTGGAAARWDTIDGRDDVLTFVRGDARVVVAFGPDPVELPAGWGEIVLASAQVTGRSLPGNSAAWLHRQPVAAAVKITESPRAGARSAVRAG